MFYFIKKLGENALNDKKSCESMVNESIDDHDKEEESQNDTSMEGSINLASNKSEVSMD